MTTIPIEVIVQDAESPVDPTPTPVDPTDQGENTNIIVPETGIGTVDNNNSNSFTGSSAAISIVSIVIAVLAIGAAIALLVRKSYKRKVDKSGMTRQEKRAMAATSTIAVLVLTVLLGQLVIAGVVSPIATNAVTDNETDHIDVADKISIVVERAEDSEETIAKVTNTSYVTFTATFGYKVTASMASDATTANLYLDGDETSEYYIASVRNEEDDEDSDENSENGALESNTWGYTLAEEEAYLPVPLADNAAIVLQGEGKMEDEEMTIYYGVNVDKDLPTGVYTGEIEYTLEPVSGFPDTLVYMQDMTPEICANAPTPGNKTTDPVPTATLIDKRDNKTYTIAKLADGNCWMTQNLDLDLDSNITLTSEDTNISTDWTPADSTIHFTDTTTNVWEYGDGKLHSADPGDIYYYTSGNEDDDITYNSLADCEAAGRRNCSNYHAGNYYTLKAAIANSAPVNTSTRYEHAPGSICPLGWRLPIGPNNDDHYYSDYGNLAASYSDIVEKDITIDCGGNCGYYNYLTSGFELMRAGPLWLTRSGFIGAGGSLQDYGKSGYYWYDVTGFQGHAPSAWLALQAFYPNVGRNSAEGYPIRCVAE